MPDGAIQPIAPSAAWRPGSKFDFIRAIKREVYGDRALVLSAPIEVGWQITLACNLSCDYCYAECSSGHPAPDPARLLAIATELGRAGVLDVTIEGGEPFACDTLFDILAELKRHRVALDILTNATLVDEHMARALAGMLDRRVDTVQVSIDSIDPRVNDRHRGAGTLAATLRGIVAFRAAGFNVRVNAVATAESAQGLPALYTAMVRLGVNGGFAVVPLFSAGRGRDHGLARPDRPVAEAVMARLRALERLTPHLGVSGALLPAVAAAACGRDLLGQRLGACSGGRAKIAIAPDGVVTPCVFYDRARFALGTLPDQSLAAIWSGEAAFRYRQWARGGTCGGCDRASDCTGVCVGMMLDDCPATRRQPTPMPAPAGSPA